MQSEKEVSEEGLEGKFIELLEKNGMFAHPVMVCVADIAVLGCENPGKNRECYMYIRGQKRCLYLDNSYDEVRSKIKEALGEKITVKLKLKESCEYEVVPECTQNGHVILKNKATNRYYRIEDAHRGMYHLREIQIYSNNGDCGWYSTCVSDDLYIPYHNVDWKKGAINGR